MKSQSVTIVDIAEKAAVSVTTVSRVINGSVKVKEDTRKRVAEIIKENNYYPNGFARGLMNKKSNTVGLIVPNIKNPFFAELISGIESILFSGGYHILLCDTGYSIEKQSIYLKSLIQQQVEGIFIISHSKIDQELLAQIKEKIAVIAVQTLIPGCDAISSDLRRGTFLMTEHLIKQGHKKIAFMCFDRLGCKEKVVGYREALDTYNLPFQEQYLVEYINMEIKDEEASLDAGYLLTKHILKIQDPPTAIQAMNDFYAIGAYQAIREAGLSIPDDISVCGFDNVGIAKLLNPPLTTVEQYPYEQGRICGEIFIQKINMETSIPKEILLPTSLVLRASTKQI